MLHYVYAVLLFVVTFAVLLFVVTFWLGKFNSLQDYIISQHMHAVWMCCACYLYVVLVCIGITYK